MNSRFPRPFEHELIWSAAARYSRRLGRNKTSFLHASLLGGKFRRLDPLLPVRLQILSSALPAEFQLPATTIRDQHTLYRVAVAGLSLDRCGRLSEQMIGGMPTGRVDPLVGKRLRVNPDYRLKYCPKCLQSDLLRYGEAGWRVPHQIPGVTCCHLHKCPLIATDATASAANLVPLDEIDLHGGPMPQDPLALPYAERAYELFSHQDFLPPNDCVMMALGRLMAVSGNPDQGIGPMTRITGMVTDGLPSVSALMDSLVELPSNAMADMRDISYWWPLNPPALVAATAVTGSTLSRVLSLAATLRHDEKPPFACANSQADCHGRNTIWKFRLAWSRHPPRAEFCCPRCGYAYCRPLPLERTGPGSLDFERTPMGFPHGRHRRGTPDLARLERKREEYLSLARRNPTALDAGQRARLERLRNWLLVHDREWVARHPTIHGRWPHSRKDRKSYRLDQMTRERQTLQLLSRISPALAQMRSGNQPRLTYARIVSKLREEAPLTQTDLREMPVLHGRLHHMVESRAAFNRRKSMNAPPDA